MVFVIAEIGVNWDGDLELAKQLMENAKKIGCNAVKFQAYLEDMVKDHPEHSRLIKSSISMTNIESINELAKSVGIEWFCTPMYPEAVDMLDPFIKKFKIREFDGRPLLENKTTKLFDRVLKTNKEVIISSQKSPKNTKYFGHPKMKWLYVVPKYPCQLTDLDFRKINEFDGYSNHSPEIIAPLTAAILGSKIIEVHITSDKSKDFVDNSVSFNYKELTELMKFITLSEKITL